MILTPLSSEINRPASFEFPRRTVCWFVHQLVPMQFKPECESRRGICGARRKRTLMLLLLLLLRGQRDGKGKYGVLLRYNYKHR